MIQSQSRESRAAVVAVEAALSVVDLEALDASDCPYVCG